MTTSTQYAAATAAIMALIKLDIAKDVPLMFQNQIPADLVSQFASFAAKAALDAAGATS